MRASLCRTALPKCPTLLRSHRHSAPTLCCGVGRVTKQRVTQSGRISFFQLSWTARVLLRHLRLVQETARFLQNRRATRSVPPSSIIRNFGLPLLFPQRRQRRVCAVRRKLFSLSVAPSEPQQRFEEECVSATSRMAVGAVAPGRPRPVPSRAGSPRCPESYGMG